jgi:hypothetical protein
MTRSKPTDPADPARYEPMDSVAPAPVPDDTSLVEIVDDCSLQGGDGQISSRQSHREVRFSPWKE